MRKHVSSGSYDVASTWWPGCPCAPTTERANEKLASPRRSTVSFRLNGMVVRTLKFVLVLVLVLALALGVIVDVDVVRTAAEVDASCPS